MTSETVTVKMLAAMIDHSLLHPTLTDEEIRKGCGLARECQVATACVKPYAVPLTRNILEGSGVGICAVVGFPHGNSTTTTKVKEAEEVIGLGASEVDAVVNIGKVLGGDWGYVAAEIRSVNDAVAGRGAILKVIFENDFLEDRHIIRLCELCSEARVAFVKTSTGYGFVKQGNGTYAYAGAVDRHLRLMREHCAPGVGIKAAGGIRTLEDVLRVRRLGVSRIGATATRAILDEARARGFA